MIEVIKNIFWFKDLNKSKASIAGAKAAYLADLYNKDFQVTNGFVISAEAFKEFLQSNSINTEIKNILKKADFEDPDSVGNASEKIKQLIMKEKISSVLESDILEAYENMNVNEELLRVSNDVLNLIKKGRSNAVVAVRSSSISDLPGACDNILGILGSKNLISSIKKCWCSLYSIGNLSNMKKKNAEDSIAVIVQKMSDVSKSGVVLSSNPMNRNKEMIIEGGFGLGKLITRGEITPDIYIIDGNLNLKGGRIGKKRLKLIRDLNTNEVVKKKLTEEQNKQVLQAWEIEDIARITQKIERLYTKPVIVEFGIGKKIEVFHVRLYDIPEIMNKGNLKGEILVEGLGGSPRINTGIITDIIAKNSKNSIIVKDHADYDLIGMLDNLKGVVVNEGSLGSCFAILCRQHGIPFVIAENSTAILDNGLIVTVDGVNGKIYKGEAKQREEKVEIVDDSYGFEVLDL